MSIFASFDKENVPIVRWDWKAQPKDICIQLNEALKAFGSDLEFLPNRDNDGDNIELMLARPRKP